MDELIRNAERAALTSVGAEGFPRTLLTELLAAEEGPVLYFAVSAKGAQAADFRVNPKASVLIAQERENVSLTGFVTQVYNRQTKADVWSSRMIGQFPQGYMDPDFCVLRFEPARR